MQLSKIKLAGFKSFVDPTAIILPSNRVAIVGPNGCGKSNIIDAITWVMGESSPKYLRGEALIDVIFNGSNARKPVGQASVELIFDNTEGKIGGEYASYAEIAIKRMISRESDSTYFLNGARCRKRDVVDLFLGTGLGPRSYSIIGQNMISKIIEAKPEELRNYLEEAAGISKYKERRHETSLRIQHAKENIARVNDLCAELEKQLSNLKHQANVAEKFKTLKQQERVLQAELYAIQWRQLDVLMVDDTLKIQHEETALEARNSEITTTDREIEQLRHEQRAAQDAYQEVQRRYYAIGNEITRIEQDILHHQEREQQWQSDLEQTENDWKIIKTQMEEGEDEAQELERDMLEVEPQLKTIRHEADVLQTELTSADATAQSWQTKWDDFNQASAKSSQIAQVEKTRIEHIEKKLVMLEARQEELQQERGRFNVNQMNNEIEALNKQSYEAADKLEFQQKELNEIRNQIHAFVTAQQDATSHLDNVRNDLQKLRGQQASLEALQQTALGQHNNPATPWIEKQNLATQPRLAQSIEVEAGWELAVEKTLGYCLQAICVDELSQVASQIDTFKSGNLCVLSQSRTKPSSGDHQKGPLLKDKVKSSWPIDSLLAGVYAAESMTDALKLCERLDEHESVVTQDGVWLNRSWLKIFRQEDPAAGVLQREQELKQLASRIKQLQKTQTELEKNIVHRREQIEIHEEKRDQLQQSYAQYQAQTLHLTAERKMKQERLEELKGQAERFMRDQEDCTEQMKQAKHEITEAREAWQQALAELEEQVNIREQLIQERDSARQQLQQMRDEMQTKTNAMHELEIRLQTAKSQRASLQQSASRLQAQLSSLNERKITLQSELSSMPPMELLKKSLSKALDKHVSVEAELNTARVSMESLDQDLRNLEDKRQQLEKVLNKIRSMLESLRVGLQARKTKSETLLEQIKVTEFTLQDILIELPQNITVEEWQTKLEQVVQRINRLGPINLIAIDEYAACLERKQYLDRQVEDLNGGLATLEEAIAKIDRETRARFKETFDEVNIKLQELFPKVFGGGKAYLELTSDDLLSAGVTMMACPPGKRNSSIYLLSGGEKSLTAIALIFSIFYLNPAPFCLLDEVDAALDDANVARFTNLVKAMSNRTQFIFISHNKITIEMAEHLIGVTMNEPGVSRLVSVDIEKAINMVETTS